MSTLHVSMIMHRLRDHRLSRALTQADMTTELAKHGFTAPSGLYARAERSPHHLRRIDCTAFRIAAARILRIPYSKITEEIDLPNPCLYCHLTPPSETCLGCNRTYTERNV